MQNTSTNYIYLHMCFILRMINLFLTRVKWEVLNALADLQIFVGFAWKQKGDEQVLHFFLFKTLFFICFELELLIFMFRIYLMC